MNAINTAKLDAIRNSLPHCLEETSLDFGKKYRGKVRDVYETGDHLVLITTDRLSAFDRHIATIPFKGQVLNLTSVWWFEQTKEKVPNHFIACPDPNVTIAKKCEVFPVEFVVRGYITGTTNTSLWTLYQKGLREFCGITLPEGLEKNSTLKQPLLTPTTKDKDHDRPITPEEIVGEGRMTQAEWEEVSALALELFRYGTELAAKRGLILVDTKYEFGRDAAGNIVVVDEIHTPDSSRYWLANSYAERIAQKLEPENIDKEFLRAWFAAHCDPYRDPYLPIAPTDLILKLSSRYIQLYEMITGNSFSYPTAVDSVHDRIRKNIAACY